MNVTSSGIVDGYYLDKYGSRGTQVNENGVPDYSIPFTITDAPESTVSFAIVLEDKDAYPISGGFVWIHWLAANITRPELLENESKKATDFVQGANSWTSIQGGQQSVELSSFYGGMCPPDAPHLYELHVFALDTLLDVKNGFLLNELHRKMEGHILDQCTLKGLYRHE
ncbi:MAG: YbhB/YbcL family Raf kinase inhibitor-like protein [Raoultibacter sp.]